MFAVGDSKELRRILALPRRKLVLSPAFDIDPQPPCQCAAMGRACIQQLYPIQITALEEAVKARGLFAPISVGAGKTVIGLLLPLVLGISSAVYLCLPGHEKQIRAEHAWLSQHVNTPELDKVIHIVPYSRLSRPEGTGLLESLAPDLIIADEGHKLRHRTSIGTRRVLKYYTARLDDGGVLFATWTGTPTSKKVADYSHLVAMALREGSPMPIDPFVVDEWGQALDVQKCGQGPSGALAKLKRYPSEPIRTALHRRLVETEGVVYSQKGTTYELPPLICKWRQLPPSPAIDAALKALHATWTRPDGEELILALDVHRTAQELACGFHYYWDFGTTESALIADWRAARAAWRKWLRYRVARAKPGLDSPALIERAILAGDIITPVAYSDWCDVRFRVKPVPKVQWLDASWIADIAQWIGKGWANISNLVWYTHKALTARLAGFITCFDDGQSLIAALQSQVIPQTTSWALSVKACSAGIDGLQHRFSNQLVACPIQSGAQLEQLLGRLHRTGQRTPVTTTFYERDRAAIEQAMKEAEYIQETMGIPQKLLTAKWV